MFFDDYYDDFDDACDDEEELQRQDDFLAQSNPGLWQLQHPLDCNPYYSEYVFKSPDKWL